MPDRQLVTRRFGLALTALGAVWLAAVPAAAQEEKTGANANLVRSVSGHYAYLTLSDATERGTEDFQLLVHPDGSRTLMIWHDLRARDAQFTVVIRAAENFRPTSVFASYWVASGYKGNVTFQVDGNRLSASGIGPDGPIAQQLEVPREFSIGTHPVAGDGWHLWYVPETAGAEGKLNLFSVEATADLSKPMLGQLVEMPFEVIGKETITVPAGRFDAIRYRLMGATDVWVGGEDRLMLRMVMERFDREYVLTRLQRTDY